MNDVTMRAIHVLAHHEEMGFSDDCPSHEFAGAFYIVHGDASRRTFDIWFDSIMLGEELSRTLEHDLMIWKDYRELVLTIGTTLVMLRSVGSFLDTCDSVIYPSDEHNRPDKTNPTNLSDINSEECDWHEKLSSADKLVIKMHIESVEHGSGVDFYTNEPLSA